MSKQESKIDRRKLTPSLIRVFVKIGSHHSDKAYADPHNLPSGEMHIHTWKDETLEVLTNLLSTAKAEIRKNKNVIISYALVYPDRCGRMVVKKLGMVEKGAINPNDDRHKTLEELKFEVGDYLDVAIKLPQRNGGNGIAMMDSNGATGVGNATMTHMNGDIHSHSHMGMHMDMDREMDRDNRDRNRDDNLFRNGRNINIRNRGDRDRMRDRDRDRDRHGSLERDRDRDRDRERREFTTRRGGRRDFYRGRGFRGSFRGRR